MRELSINLEEFEANLERINELVNKMAFIDWNNETAVQFCREHSLIITDCNIPLLNNWQDILNKLNNFNYEIVKEKISICQQQASDLKGSKLNSYNISYMNHINIFFDTINEILNRISSIDAFCSDIYTYLHEILKMF